MLNYTTLNNKKQIRKKGPDGYDELQFDLMTPVFDNLNVPIQDVIIVNKYYVARPDLISLAVYGTDKYADLICKYNGISNPFEMNEDDVIYIPNASEFTSLYVDSATPSELIDDSTTSSFGEKKNQFIKNVNDKRSPAQQVEGEPNYVIDKSMGVVFY